ncbi:MAG TPA: prepilin-type N-terminal cleavage/methylation domain-containing protein [Candidatus Saccharimonadales bacterium]
MQRSPQSLGFTIVELLIVIVVVVILASIGFSTISDVQRKARDAERDSDVRSLVTYLELFYNGPGQGSYPRIYSDTTPGSGASQVNLSNDTDVKAKIADFDLEVLRAPQRDDNSIIFATNNGTPPISTPGTVNAGFASTVGYLYQPRTATGERCISETQICTQYKIHYVKESDTSAVITRTGGQ